MSRCTPVIRTDIRTGEQVRFPSIRDGAASIGVRPSQISIACLYECQCHGYFWRKVEGD